MNELRCQQCGCVAYLSESNGNMGKRYLVHCSNVECGEHTRLFKSPAIAMIVWNWRKTK